MREKLQTSEERQEFTQNLKKAIETGQEGKLIELTAVPKIIEEDVGKQVGFDLRSDNMGEVYVRIDSYDSKTGDFKGEMLGNPTDKEDNSVWGNVKENPHITGPGLSVESKQAA